MATKPTLKDVFERNKYDLATVANKSKGWFEKEVTMLTKQQLTPAKVLSGNADQLVTKVMPGRLYMYAYDPKMKKELPYYDRFPLVFPFSKTPDGFIGLNMHYLPYQLRVRLLDRLLEYANNKKYDETTRIRYSWATIRSASKFVLAKPCVHSYLYDHIQSTMLRVSPENWFTVMMLPVERFTVNKSNVWADSIGKI